LSSGGGLVWKLKKGKFIGFARNGLMALLEILH
jgi:hypothetical protein